MREINKDFLTAWNTKIIDVRVSRGKDSLCAVSQRCHQNTSYMQMKYGGEVVSGFSINDSQGTQLGHQGDLTMIEPHSVLKTIDGEYVDVSLGCLDEDTIRFAPVISYDPSKEYYDIFERYSFFDNDFVRIVGNGQIRDTHSYDFWKGKDFTSLAFHRHEPMTSCDLWEEFIEDRKNIERKNSIVN